MLKLVISVVSIFSMMCLDIPKKVIKVIGQKMRKFFGNGSNKGDKIPLLAWERICRPKDKGGVGIKN